MPASFLVFHQTCKAHPDELGSEYYAEKYGVDLLKLRKFKSNKGRNKHDGDRDDSIKEKSASLEPFCVDYEQKRRICQP